MNEKKFLEKSKDILNLPRLWYLTYKFDNNNRGNWDDDQNALGGINFLYGLYDLILENFDENFTIAEIGCLAGISTSLFASACKFVYAIDPWNLFLRYKDYGYVNKSPIIIDAEIRFDINMSKYKNFKKIKNFSYVVYKDFDDESLDAVYIDGDHDVKSVYNDIMLWIPKIKKNGILCGHDYKSPEVSEVLKKSFPQKYPLKHYCDMSWVIKKNEI